jgi:hypothetical protein
MPDSVKARHFVGHVARPDMAGQRPGDEFHILAKQFLSVHDTEKTVLGS